MAHKCCTSCVIVKEPADIELENCCCYDDLAVTGDSFNGGWANQTFPCNQCKSGDLLAQWKLTIDPNNPTPRSYVMTGLSDTCSNSQSYQEIDFAFYSIIRTDVAAPYWIVYIYESGANRSWFVYDRQNIPECREFQIRRIGSNIEYYVDGNLVRTTPDTTGGACLYLDDSWHGTLNTGDIQRSNTSLCEIVE